MNQNEFRVMEWLRALRDTHSEKVYHKSCQEIHQETKEAADRMTKKINEKRKQHEKE